MTATLEYNPDNEVRDLLPLEFRFLYSLDRVSELLGVSRRAIGAWIDRGDLVAVQPRPGRLWIHIADLIDFTEDRAAFSPICSALRRAAWSDNVPAPPWGAGQFALLCGVSADQVQYWIQEGLPVGVEGRVRFARATLDWMYDHGHVSEVGRLGKLWDFDPDAA